MKYPGAIWYPSEISHAAREGTWGVVIHWTAGHKAGDLAALNGPDVDVQFYVDKAGEVYQFVDSGSQAWHAFHTANHYCVGIEHEGSGEAWTDAQFKASAKLARWVCDQYHIPIRHVDPPTSWRGLYGHRDLAHIDGNDHTDTVPAAIGWPRYIEAIQGLTPPPDGLITPPYFDWLAWTLGEKPFKGKPFDHATRPKNWTAGVPTGYWSRREEFLANRK